MTQYGYGRPERSDPGASSSRPASQQSGGGGEAVEFGTSTGSIIGAVPPDDINRYRIAARQETSSRQVGTACVCVGNNGFIHARGINVGLAERLASALAGSWLFMGGLKRLIRRKPLGAVALAAAGGSLTYRAISGRSALYSVLGVEEEPETFSHPLNKRIAVHESITIQKSATDIYHFWRDVENLGCVMKNLLAVQQIDDRRSRWLVRGPAERYIEWEASIIDEEPDRYIAWDAQKSGKVRHHGVVLFEPAPGDRGCRVHVHLVYKPPGGAFGAVAAKVMLRDPCMLIREDLHRLKQFLEAGEVATSAGPSGRWSIAGQYTAKRGEFGPAVRHDRMPPDRSDSKLRGDDDVVRASEASFPASDPPSWSQTTI